MYVIELTYKASLAEVNKHLEAHRAFLDVYYERGIFLASGPKVPREGGIIGPAGANQQNIFSFR